MKDADCVDAKVWWNNNRSNVCASQVAKMMEKMGHLEGKGLGKAEQGITQPVKNAGWVECS